MEETKNTETSLELAQWIANTLDRKGAHDIVVLETKPGTYVADYLVIATGTSSRHMHTLLETPCHELKKLGYPPLYMENEGSHWMLADLGDIVLHIFDDESRHFYDLDGLWKNAPKVSWIENDKKKSLASPMA